MAKVSICDYCKSISKKDFNHWIDLVDYNVGESEKEERFEICKSCFESLQARLNQSEIPQAASSILSDISRGDSPVTNVPTASYLQSMMNNNGAPTEALLEHELTKVPSRRDEVVEEDDKTCKHKYDMQQNSVGEMYMACVKCDVKMETESIS